MKRLKDLIIWSAVFYCAIYIFVILLSSLRQNGVWSILFFISVPLTYYGIKELLSTPKNSPH